VEPEVHRFLHVTLAADVLHASFRLCAASRRRIVGPVKLYDFLSSGNAYKVRLLLHQLEIPFERVEMNILEGATRTPEFLAKNPNGRIPTLELDDGTILTESNAILFYLADGTPHLPGDRLTRARVLQWLFFEQYEHEPNIATVRFWLHYLPELDDARKAQLPGKRERGDAALGVMDRHLAKNPFFVGGYSIADIALYAYTHVADEGGFDLSRHANVQAWMDRVRAQPRHVPITRE
jgi:glutathione S-transferase